MTKAVAYERVSYSGQVDGYSLETQRQAREEYAAKHGIEVVATFAGQESAFSPGRTGFERMVRFLEENGDVRTVLVYKIDRSSRNLYDYGMLVDKLGVSIVSVTEDLPANAAGRLVGDNLAAFGRFYSAQLSERTKAGMLTKAKSGTYPTYAPIGYVNQGRNIVPDPVVGPFVSELFQRYARTDDSLLDLAQWAKKRGIKSRYGHPMSKAVIHTILQNPVYTGRFRWGGKEYDGTHEPIISVELFCAVQDKMHGRGSPRVTKMEFPYRGFLTCGYCGCQLTAEMKKGRYVYYHCTHNAGECQQPNWSQDKLSEHLASVFEPLRMSDAVAKQLLDFAVGTNEARRKENAARKITLRDEEARIIERLDAMYEDRLDGKITEEEWVRRQRQQSDRLLMVRSELDRITTDTDINEEDVRIVIELVQRLPEAYLERSHEERAALLKVVQSNCRVTAESVDPVYKEPFAGIAKWQDSPTWLPVIDALRNAIADGTDALWQRLVRREREEAVV